MLEALVRGRAQVNAQAPETTNQDSRGPRVPRAGISGLDALGLLLAAAAFIGAVLLVVSDFTTLFNVHTDAGVTVPRRLGEGPREPFLLDAHHRTGLPSARLRGDALRQPARDDGPRRTRPHRRGHRRRLRPLDATGTNTLARTFENASGSPAVGFYLETLGAALLIISGGGGLVLTAPDRRPGSPPPAQEETESETSPRDRREEERAAAAAARAEARARRGGG